MLCVVKVSGALAPVSLEECVVHVVSMVFTWFVQCACDRAGQALFGQREELLGGISSDLACWDRFGVVSPRGRRTERGRRRVVIGLRVLRKGVEVDWCYVEVCGVNFHLLHVYTDIALIPTVTDRVVQTR
ncbi:hypothetical protein Taro_047170 [Colocasia esculenta]|uniref:Uncharacterized protein n=1 Tax=Colocasia esculenta TaxID=4460 RepID=A0A843X7T5_COLES|nr:hypothetical protein [Colocasia esculenta]